VILSASFDFFIIIFVLRRNYCAVCGSLLRGIISCQILLVLSRTVRFAPTSLERSPSDDTSDQIDTSPFIKTICLVLKAYAMIIERVNSEC
jgi:hypothetical protein